MTEPPISHQLYKIAAESTNYIDPYKVEFIPFN